MGYGIGKCSIYYGRTVSNKPCCVKKPLCEVLKELGPKIEFKASNRQITKFHYSYVHFSVIDPTTGSATHTYTLGWHSGQRSLTPQPIAGRTTYSEYIHNTTEFLEGLKRIIHHLSDHKGNKATEETGDLDDTIKQLRECSRLLKRTIEGSELGTHPFTGAVGLPTGHHGAYTDNTWRALYHIAKTACKSNYLRLNGAGWTAKARPLKLKRKKSYDVLTFIIQKNYIILKGNWTEKERERLYELLEEKLGTEIIPNA